MIGCRRRLRALAVPAQVGRHDREALCKARGDFVPHHVGLRMAVQEQKGRPGAAAPNAERRLADVDALEVEAGEKLGHRGILCEKIVRVCALAGS